MKFRSGFAGGKSAAFAATLTRMELLQIHHPTGEAYFADNNCWEQAIPLSISTQDGTARKVPIVPYFKILLHYVDMPFDVQKWSSARFQTSDVLYWQGFYLSI